MSHARSGAPRVRLRNLREGLEYLGRLGPVSGRAAEEPWTFPQVLVHCAQSIEYSLTGYPKPRNALVQATVGRMAKHHFLGRGALSHDRTAPIPGAPEIPAHVTRAEALARLTRAVDQFEAFAGPYAPHFTFGSASKAEYELLHAFHLADHLSAFPAAAESQHVQA
ncbi:MAG TPA: DUF1569 domain-containing protein [Polyangiaceae bacterium]|nr:DUF1569 domain-containing protein [Polyangiaceae bacterium]